MTRISILARSAMLVPVLILVCHSISAQNRIHGRVVDASNSGIQNIPVIVKDAHNNILGSGSSQGLSGEYTAKFTPTKGPIKATYGNLIYPKKVVWYLSGQTNHELTIILVKGSANNPSYGQGEGAVSTIQHLKENPQALQTKSLELGLSLDESMFPPKLQSQVLELKAAVTQLVKKDASLMNLTGTILSQENNGWFTMQTKPGVTLKVKLVRDGLCGNKLDGILKPCERSLVVANGNLVGQQVEVSAFVNGVYGIALAERLKIAAQIEF